MISAAQTEEDLFNLVFSALFIRKYSRVIRRHSQWVHFDSINRVGGNRGKEGQSRAISVTSSTGLSTASSLRRSRANHFCSAHHDALVRAVAPPSFHEIADEIVTHRETGSPKLLCVQFIATKYSRNKLARASA